MVFEEMSAAIEFSNVSLEYGLGNELIKVLKCISFSVNSDETVSIVGPSGSGKTSIIMLAAGLEKSTEGSIKVHNQEITNLKENDLSQIRRQNIGIVFQSFYLIPNSRIKRSLFNFFPIFTAKYLTVKHIFSFIFIFSCHNISTLYLLKSLLRLKTLPNFQRIYQ